MQSGIFENLKTSKIQQPVLSCIYLKNDYHNIKLTSKKNQIKSLYLKYYQKRKAVFTPSCLSAQLYNPVFAVSHRRQSQLMPNMIAPLPSCFRSVRTNIHFNIRLPLPNSHQKRGFTNLSSGDVKDNPGTERRISLQACSLISE